MEASRPVLSNKWVSPAYMPIDAELLRQLYTDECLTISQIAARLGCGETTIVRRLRRFAIPARPRGPRPGAGTPSWGRLPSPIGWSPQIAWAVGVIATDGCLGRDERRLTVTSKDFDFLAAVRECLGVRAAVTRYQNGPGRSCFHLQWGDRELYAWLRHVGLTPAKSLTLGPLAVPDEHFADFFRGCIDGDGSILVYTDRYHAVKNERYVYERLYVSLVSASRPFPEWIQATVDRLIGVTGVIGIKLTPGRRPVWRLRYAKSESIRLLHWMYYAPTVPCLARKRAKAEQFM